MSMMYDADVDANRVVGVAQTGSPNLDASNNTGVRGCMIFKFKGKIAEGWKAC
jgi:hypothetical protein